MLSEEKMAQKIKEHAIAQYWNDYYAKAKVYEKTYPNRFRIVQMNDLNIIAGVNAILDFCEINEERQILFVHKLSDG